MKTIKKLEENKEKLLDNIKLLEEVGTTRASLSKIKEIESKISTIDIKIETLEGVLKMMSDDMQFIGAGATEQELRENITGEPRHRGCRTGN